MNRGEMPLNIPVGGDGDGPRNNPNRPAWTQVSQLFVNAVFPAVCMGVAGYFATHNLKLSVELRQCRKREEEVKEYLKAKEHTMKERDTFNATVMDLEKQVVGTVDKDLAKLQKDFEDSKSEVSRLKSLLSHSVRKSEAICLIDTIEHEQECMRKSLSESLEAKKCDILNILDIACSPIRARDSRTVLQQNLVDNVSHPSSILAPIHMAPDLCEIFEYDTKFCGLNKSQNGKIWRIYAKLWEEKAEKMKYKRAWEDLKEAFASNS